MTLSVNETTLYITVEKDSIPRLYVRDPDLQKGKIKGARKKTERKARFGILISSHPSFYPTKGGVRYLESTKEQADAAKKIARYAARGISVQYIPPKDFLKFNMHAHGIARENEAKTTTTEAPSVPKEVEEVLIEQKTLGEEHEFVGILRERVAEWSRPSRFRNIVDPKHVEEYKKLLKLRSQFSRQTGKIHKQRMQRLLSEIRVVEADVKKNRKGAEEKLNTLQKRHIAEKRLTHEGRAMISQDYEIVSRRISQLEGRSHATAGGGHFEIAPGEIRRIGGMPYHDFGVDPIQKPMSYLISLGWHKKVKSGVNKGENSFSSNEMDALLYEYEPRIRRYAWSVANRFELDQDFQKDLFAAGVESLFGEARNWNIKARGAPSDSNHFALYMSTSLELLMRNHAKEIIGKLGKTLPLSELDDMPSIGGRKMTPGTRVETPEQYHMRKLLSREVADIFGRRLAPVERFVVMSRLNIYNQQSEGIRAGKLQIPVTDWETGQSIVQELKMDPKRGEGVKTWDDVRADVVAAMKTMFGSDSEESKSISKMSDFILRKIFNKAINKLRQPENLGLTAKEQRTIAELAHYHTPYLAGIRHTIFDPMEAIHKLVIKPSPVSEKEISNLETKHGRVVDKIKVSKPGKAREKLVKQRLELSGKLAELRGQRRLTQKRKEVKAPRLIIPTHKKASQFWSSRRGQSLATQLQLDLSYMQYREQANVDPPTAIQAQKMKAEGYFKVITSLRIKTPASLRGFRDKTPEGGRTLQVGKLEARLPRTDIVHMVDTVLAELKRKKEMKKSFVIVDYKAELESLAEECGLWDMNLK